MGPIVSEGSQMGWQGGTDFSQYPLEQSDTLFSCSEWVQRFVPGFQQVTQCSAASLMKKGTKCGRLQHLRVERVSC